MGFLGELFHSSDFDLVHCSEKNFLEEVDIREISKETDVEFAGEELSQFTWVNCLLGDCH